MERLLRIVFWTALSIYLGGMLALGVIVAPMVFRTAEGLHLTSPELPAAINQARQVGGEIFGNILARFGVVEMLCLAALGLTIVAHLVLVRPRRPQAWIKLALVAVLAAVLLYDRTAVTSAVWQERAAWRAAAADAPAAAAHQARFDALHRTAETLGKVRLWLLVGLLVAGAWGASGRGKD